MTFIEDLSDAVSRLSVFDELSVEASRLPASVSTLSDSSVRDLLAEVAAVVRSATTLQSVLAGVAAARSGRDRGHRGLVQEGGHRNAVEFIRDLTGGTRAEAIRAVRVGEALVEGVDVDPGDQQQTDPANSPALWHEPLRAALLAGAITAAQHHAIRAGLGEPPLLEGRESDAVHDVWRSAAARLADEAPLCTVEDLGARSRVLRDMLDPAGAEERFAARFDRRSYRSSRTADGMRSAHIVFDDEMGAWVEAMMDAALAPRRGGPRFVDSARAAAAEALSKEARTNDQLAYDLFIDHLRAGALANADDVFGAREAGVRLVAIRDAATGDAVSRDAFGRLLATAHSEDGSLALPGSSIERALCATGSVTLTVDSSGKPLDVGREQRLFTPRQRLMLAVRDGGCIWPSCDRPPAYCEAHHCEHWADGGRTDCDVGVLLCRYHHLHLHNAGWRITRRDDGRFVLHAPPGSNSEPVLLMSKSPLRWLWDPPPDRVGWRLAA
ncbi:HNH endonuclease signature motif containing protein [Microbacterium aoyamense]|uniref:HNH endonuclease signature motif containing protein n=1 Tax=Microbacterium aoyamense TaxID=344166 RepID=A0ABN2PRM5_9MICO|nr:HNH endonuclease signature motif containing protein [Microbacterium aoyamense]